MSIEEEEKNGKDSDTSYVRLGLHKASMPKWYHYNTERGGLNRDPQKWLRNMWTVPYICALQPSVWFDISRQWWSATFTHSHTSFTSVKSLSGAVLVEQNLRNWTTPTFYLCPETNRNWGPLLIIVACSTQLTVSGGRFKSVQWCASWTAQFMACNCLFCNYQDGDKSFGSKIEIDS